MKNTIISLSKLIVVMIGLCTYSCSDSDEERQSFDNVGTPATKDQGAKIINNSPIDTSVFIIDTTLNNVDIDGRLFTVFVSHDKYNEHHQLNSEDDETYTKLTVTILDPKDNEIAYSKVQNENQFEIFKIGHKKLSSNGNLFLELRAEYGGSGFAGRLCLIHTDSGKIKINTITPYGVLSYIGFSKNDDRILTLDGSWNFDEHETHFSRHRYYLYQYTYQNGNYKEDSLGKTVNKYSSLDDGDGPEETLREMKQKEPELTKDINVDEFVFLNSDK